MPIADIFVPGRGQLSTRPSGRDTRYAPSGTLRLSRHASFHLVGRRGVLFDARAQRLYAMNRGAGFIWCCLAEGYTPLDIADAYAMHARISIQQAKTGLMATLRTWQSIGLIGMEESDEDERGQSADRPGAPHTTAAASVATAPAFPNAASVGVRILDTTFDVMCGIPSIDGSVVPILRGFAPAGPDQAAEQLEIVPVGSADAALRHGGATRWTGPQAQVTCAAFASLVRLSLERSRTYPAVHSAAVAGARGVVLFSGPSGCGKSTLMAALLAAGRDVLCDDTVVLDQRSMRIRPVAPHLCLKSGAWHAIEPRIAAFPDGPALRRPDGALVRYLALDRRSGRDGRARSRGYAVRSIVFPRYRPGGAANLVPIGAAAALQRLACCIDPLGHPLSSTDIERLIRWVGGLDCYTLTHDSLDDAVTALGGLLQ